MGNILKFPEPKLNFTYRLINGTIYISGKVPNIFIDSALKKGLKVIIQ
jgi:hypothetical protein